MFFLGGWFQKIQVFRMFPGVPLTGLQHPPATAPTWDFNYQPQLVVSRISEPSTVSLAKTNCELNTCPGCTKKNAPPKDKAHLKCLRGV